MIKLDHKKIGEDKLLFTFHDFSPGQVFWLPYGNIMLNNLKQYLRNILIKYQYLEVDTPTIFAQDMWKKTGHWDKFNQNMIKLDNKALKPMNCPGHLILINKIISIKNSIPIKLMEYNSCYRQEPSGSLNGLFRLTKFTQDDSHILCSEKDITQHINIFYDIVNNVYKKLGFNEIKIYISTNTELTYVNEILIKSVKEITNKNILLKEGDGAFYGPKLDICLLDANNREWQCGTFQIDFETPKKMKLPYITNNSILIHHAILGTFERFIGIILENNESIPFIINPKKIAILILNNCSNNDYINKVLSIIYEKINMQETIKEYSKNISGSIKKYIKSGFRYIFIIGINEIHNNTVYIRDHILEKQVQIDQLQYYIQHMYLIL